MLVSHLIYTARGGTEASLTSLIFPMLWRHTHTEGNMLQFPIARAAAFYFTPHLLCVLIKIFRSAGWLHVRACQATTLWRRRKMAGARKRASHILEVCGSSQQLRRSMLMCFRGSSGVLWDYARNVKRSERAATSNRRPVFKIIKSNRRAYFLLVNDVTRVMMWKDSTSTAQSSNSIMLKVSRPFT